MIKEHIDATVENMKVNGEYWAQIRLYINKTSSMEMAYIQGFVDAYETLKTYILYHKLDKPATRCYTKRKAHKK
jgi:hypothetical protein